MKTKEIITLLLWTLSYIVILYNYFTFQESKLKEVQKSNLKEVTYFKYFFYLTISTISAPICKDKEFTF